jgi:hypothetical protein
LVLVLHAPSASAEAKTRSSDLFMT